MADMLGAADADEIKFGPNMTTLTFHVSRSIGATMAPGDEIVLTGLDHDGNVEPWLGARARSRARRSAFWEPRLDDCTLDLDGPRRAARTADAARRGRLGVERGRDDQPGRRDRPAGPCRRRLDVRRRGPRGAAPADRRPGGRDRLPRLLDLQVLRAARRRPLRPGRRPRRDPDLQAPAGPRPVRDGHRQSFESQAGHARGGRVPRRRSARRTAAAGAGRPARRARPGRHDRDPRLRDGPVPAPRRRPRGDPGPAPVRDHRSGALRRRGRRPRR